MPWDPGLADNIVQGGAQGDEFEAVVDEGHQIAEQAWVNNSMAIPLQAPPRGRKQPIRRGPGKADCGGQEFFVWADEVRYNNPAPGKPITTAALLPSGQLVLFSTETGDAWLLEPPPIRLAGQGLARDGESETDPHRRKAIPRSPSVGRAAIPSHRRDRRFVYSDQDTGRVANHPRATRPISSARSLDIGKFSNILG